MNLNDLFKMLKVISEDLVLALENDNLDLLESLILKRQAVLNNIIELGSKEEIQNFYKEYDMVKLDNIIKEKFQNKMDNLKEEMVRLRKGKNASKSYNNLKAKAIYLSKEI